MAQKEYIVEGRRFRTEADYARASRDKVMIDKLRVEIAEYTPTQLEAFLKRLRGGEYRFQTLLGQDFADEIEELIRNKKEKPVKKFDSVEIDAIARKQLAKAEKRRKWLVFTAGVIAVGCLGYFGVYSYFDFRTASTYEEMAQLTEQVAGIPKQTHPEEPQPQIHYIDEADQEIPEILEEYKILYNKNKKLIGWLKIDDTIINYPVMQTTDNTYYQDHNLEQKYDKNGSIFLDKDCDVLKPSTNLILYGHHMKSGQMFGTLDLYEDKEYFEKHPYIQFDSIYEKGTYQVMYVFRSRVYKEEEIVFKYYQFIDAGSEQEFDSNMQEMAAVSLYDTGVTAQYGDRLLTLSTCDYQEKDGRFVVVAKRVAAKE